jgi:hypothetical protein
VGEAVGFGLGGCVDAGVLAGLGLTVFGADVGAEDADGDPPPVMQAVASTTTAVRRQARAAADEATGPRGCIADIVGCYARSSREVPGGGPAEGSRAAGG